MDGPAIFAARRMGPNDVNEMLYTSGTTGQPKGVMHTANTQFGSLQSLAPAIGLSRSDTLLMGSPLAHQTGFLYGIMMPLYLGIKAVYQDGVLRVTLPRQAKPESQRVKINVS